MDIYTGRALKEQRVASLQNDLTGRLFDSLATTGHSHQNHVVVFLERGLAHTLVDQTAAEVDISRMQLSVAVYLTHGEHVVVGIDQSVAVTQV